MKTETERLQDLAATVAGAAIGAAGYHQGTMINEEEIAADAIAIAREIIRQSALQPSGQNHCRLIDGVWHHFRGVVGGSSDESPCLGGGSGAAKGSGGSTLPT